MILAPLWKVPLWVFSLSPLRGDSSSGAVPNEKSKAVSTLVIELVQAKHACLRSPTSNPYAAGERSVYALVPFSGELKLMARTAIGSESAGLSSR